MEIPLRRGRLLTDRETPAAPRAIVINEALARKHFANEDPLGKRITFSNPDAADAQWWTIVGIVGDVWQISLQRLRQGSDPLYGGGPQRYVDFGLSDLIPLQKSLRSSVQTTVRF